MNGVPALSAALLDREADKILAHIAYEPTDILVIPQNVWMSFVSRLVRFWLRPHMQRLLEEDVKRRSQPTDIHAADYNISHIT